MEWRIDGFLQSLTAVAPATVTAYGSDVGAFTEWAERAGHTGISRLPFSLKILLENLLRREDGRFVHAQTVAALAGWDVRSATQQEIAFTPARVLLQDFTGVPAVVDLAAMRSAMQRLGGDPAKVPEFRANAKGIPMLPLETLAV